MQDDVRSRFRDGRIDQRTEGRDMLEHSEADIQTDIELALLKMRAETLTRIDEALIRLDAGDYGSCFQCHGEIAERRLRALPFAVRCSACEEQRERGQDLSRQPAYQRPQFALFTDVFQEPTRH